MSEKAKTKRLPTAVALQAINLGQLSGGYVGKCIDRELEKIHRDLDSRGDDGKVRELVIRLGFKSTSEGRIRCASDVRAKLPAYRPEDTLLKPDQAAGGMLFKPDCADNPEQLTMEVDDNGEIVG